LREIIDMLDANGMKMNKKHAQEFFDVLDADKSGGLSIAEFKDFLFSEDCKIKFRTLMRRLREEQR
jgi:Ca2+-binding EF-hand superfamily protein